MNYVGRNPPPNRPPPKPPPAPPNETTTWGVPLHVPVGPYTWYQCVRRAEWDMLCNVDWWSWLGLAVIVAIVAVGAML